MVKAARTQTGEWKPKGHVAFTNQANIGGEEEQGSNKSLARHNFRFSPPPHQIGMHLLKSDSTRPTKLPVPTHASVTCACIRISVVAVCVAVYVCACVFVGLRMLSPLPSQSHFGRAAVSAEERERVNRASLLPQPGKNGLRQKGGRR